MVGRSSVLAASLAGTLLFVLAMLGLSSESPHGAPPACHAYSDAMLPMHQAEGQLSWSCGPEAWEDGRALTWLRFSQWNRADPPRLFTSRITVFRSITIAAIDADGVRHIRHYGPEDARPLLAGPIFGVALPEPPGDIEAFLVRIERPHSVTVGSEAMLRSDHQAHIPPVSLVLLAVVAGMLIMPLLFDLMCFMVLRERFVLLHGGMVVTMLAYVLTAGGIVTAFAELPLPLLAIAGPASFALGAALAGLFISAFLEPGILPAWMCRTVNITAALAAGGACFCALQLEATQGFDNSVYFLCLVPLLTVYFAAIGLGLWRNSRAARYLAAAFVPIFATGLERMLRGLGFYAAPSSIDYSLFFTLGLEVIIVALGVADRLLSIRRERDQAIDHARTLKQLSERDSLTGLLNRRVIEDRYAMLRQDGFTALAVIDLDHFKRVNDTFGHTTGDLVLQVVGRALEADDPDLMAFRMGGEEFLLLVRGSDAVQRAERQRQEIARAVAQEDLGCLVTASMGIVEVTGGALPGASFPTIYARADRLLYEAKATGRNRMVCERIKTFQPRRGDRRAA